MKQKIAIDIDDVLSQSAAAFIAYGNKMWGHSLTPEDYNEHWGEMWQVDIEETERRALKFHADGIVADYPPIADAKPVLEYLSSEYELLPITSRRLSIEPHTKVWLDAHFGGILSEVQFAGIFDAKLDKDTWKRTKADLFASNEVSFVIDDQLKHCIAAAELGIETLLFGTYRWNETDKTLSELITRVADWDEVRQYFEARRTRQ